jgi:putative ABC transport system substrate-binding protein
VEGLRELGYTEGETIVVERHLSQDQTGEAFSRAAAELVRMPVDVIVTSSTPALLAAAQASTSIPVVAAGPNRNLIDLGLASSLARPGRNVTGLMTHPGLNARGIELLRETLPGMQRLGYLRNAATAGTADEMTRVAEAARALGLEFFELTARVPDDIDSAFDAAVAARLDGLVVAGDFLFGDPSGWRVVDLPLRYGLPTLYTQVAGYVDRGGLMGYAADYAGFHRRAAVFVDKLLKGADPAQLPLEQASIFEFVINLNTARALGIALPERILVQATQVIQ